MLIFFLYNKNIIVFVKRLEKYQLFHLDLWLDLLNFDANNGSTIYVVDYVLLLSLLCRGNYMFFPLFLSLSVYLKCIVSGGMDRHWR